MFQLIGSLLAFAGIWISLQIKSKEIKNHIDVLSDPALLMSILGCIIFIIGFFGCLGALRENICLLKSVSF